MRLLKFNDHPKSRLLCTLLALYHDSTKLFIFRAFAFQGVDSYVILCGKNEEPLSMKIFVGLASDFYT